MFKKTLMATAVSVAALGITQGALAAVSQTSANSVTYATELFGTGASATVLTNGADITLTTDAAIDAGEAADITFTLTNATFGQAVTLGDVTVNGAAGGDVNGAATVTLKSGGAVGDSSVTINVDVTAAFDANDTVSLNVAAIQEAAALATAATKVTAVATITQTATGGGNAFPSTIGNATAGTTDLVATSADEVALTVNDGTDAEVDVDNRSDITTNAVAITDGTAILDGVAVAAATYALNGAGVNAANGVFANVAGDTIELSLSGTLNTGDQVFIDLDGDAAIDAGESFTVDAAANSATLSLDATGTLPAADTVYYVANGTDTLAPATFTLTATSAFAEATYATESDNGSASTSYSGLSADGWALAVPPSTSSDVANIRVTNETGATVSLFAQGYATDGSDLGFQEIGTISANETKRFTSSDLEAIFGTWTGRARFDFSSSGNISVQSLVRSGGILNNMSATTIQGDAR